MEKQSKKDIAESMKKNTSLRTKEDLHKATEEIFNKTLSGAISPKVGDVLNTCVKMVVKLNVDIPLKIESIFQKGKGRLYWLSEGKVDKLLE